MGRPRKKPEGFQPGQKVEPVEFYVGEIDGTPYMGRPGDRLDGGDAPVQAWPHLHQLLDPDAYKKDQE